MQNMPTKDQTLRNWTQVFSAVAQLPNEPTMQPHWPMTLGQATYIPQGAHSIVSLPPYFVQPMQQTSHFNPMLQQLLHYILSNQKASQA